MNYKSIKYRVEVEPERSLILVNKLLIQQNDEVVKETSAAIHYNGAIEIRLNNECDVAGFNAIAKTVDTIKELLPIITFLNGIISNAIENNFTSNQLREDIRLLLDDKKEE